MEANAGLIRRRTNSRLSYCCLNQFPLQSCGFCVSRPPARGSQSSQVPLSQLVAISALGIKNQWRPDTKACFVGRRALCGWHDIKRYPTSGAYAKAFRERLSSDRYVRARSTPTQQRQGLKSAKSTEADIRLL